MALEKTEFLDQGKLIPNWFLLVLKTENLKDIDNLQKLQPDIFIGVSYLQNNVQTTL